jgi:hypothetical protein
MRVNAIPNQIDIFALLERHQIEYIVSKGANFIVCPKTLILDAPVGLGDKILKVGDMMSKLGDKERTSFEMQDGHYLKYVGRLSHNEDILIFKSYPYRVRSDKWDDCYYMFTYVDKNTLLIFTKNHAAADIKINTIELTESEEKEND